MLYCWMNRPFHLLNVCNDYTRLVFTEITFSMKDRQQTKEDEELLATIYLNQGNLCRIQVRVLQMISRSTLIYILSLTIRENTSSPGTYWSNQSTLERDLMEADILLSQMSFTKRLFCIRTWANMKYLNGNWRKLGKWEKYTHLSILRRAWFCWSFLLTGNSWQWTPNHCLDH